MPLNETDVRALTYLAKRIRTETHGCGPWDEAGIAAKIGELKGQGLSQAAERVIRHAGDREARTPGAILRPFLPDPQADRTPHVRRTPADYCADCSQPLDEHRATDHNPVRRTEQKPQKAADYADKARRAIGDTKAKDGPA